MDDVRRRRREMTVQRHSLPVSIEALTPSRDGFFFFFPFTTATSTWRTFFAVRLVADFGERMADIRPHSTGDPYSRVRPSG